MRLVMLCALQDSVKLLVCKSLHVADSLGKALDEEIRKKERD